jgi:hypothetical protein
MSLPFIGIGIETVTRDKTPVVPLLDAGCLICIRGDSIYEPQRPEQHFGVGPERYFREAADFQRELPVEAGGQIHVRLARRSGTVEFAVIGLEAKIRLRGLPRESNVEGRAPSKVLDTNGNETR